MGRRKKEPASAHRQSIASAAERLFMAKGIQSTSMDEIAQAAGYSKATLYVYFENKEEIVSVLVLESMEKLDSYLRAALEQQKTTKQTYDLLCCGLVHYQEEFPFYFQMALFKINTDFEENAYRTEEKETYRVGEEINKKMKQFLMRGIANGEIRADIAVVPTILASWGMLSGFIQMAANKELYIAKEMKLAKQSFLEYGFNTLYRSIANQGVIK